MKAILEFEAPETCWDCIAFGSTEWACYCNALSDNGGFSEAKARRERLPDCPLRFEE